VDQRTFQVRGHVQGVGFRWWTRSQATRLGISGTVRNCDDGSVEVRARGSADAVARLRELLGAGPRGARVQRVEEGPASDLPAEGFEIIH
jgi:acylphosphatase